MQMYTLALALALFAAPLSLSMAKTFDASAYKQDLVVVPSIESPKANDVWTVGSSKTIKWDPSVVEKYPEASNNSVVVHLGMDRHGSPYVGQQLGGEAKLSDGNMTVKVPNVADGDDYIVIVFGDSGNASPKFRITGHKNATTATTGMADTAGKIEKEIANLITGDQKAQKDKESKNKKTTSGNAAVKRHARRHFQA